MTTGEEVDGCCDTYCARTLDFSSWYAMIQSLQEEIWPAIFALKWVTASTSCIENKCNSLAIIGRVSSLHHQHFLSESRKV